MAADRAAAASLAGHHGNSATDARHEPPGLVPQTTSLVTQPHGYPGTVARRDRSDRRAVPHRGAA